MGALDYIDDGWSEHEAGDDLATVRHWLAENVHQLWDHSGHKGSKPGHRPGRHWGQLVHQARSRGGKASVAVQRLGRSSLPVLEGPQGET
jgi:hypothetical protein